MRNDGVKFQMGKWKENLAVVLRVLQTAHFIFLVCIGRQCPKIYNTRAHLLFYTLKLSFLYVLDTVVVVFCLCSFIGEKPRIYQNVFTLLLNDRTWYKTTTKGNNAGQPPALYQAASHLFRTYLQICVWDKLCGNFRFYRALDDTNISRVGYTGMFTIEHGCYVFQDDTHVFS